MRRYITILIFTFIFFFTFPVTCLADVQATYPLEGAILQSRNIRFQWKNSDASPGYSYMLEVGPSAVEGKNWYPKVGISVPLEVSYTYNVPAEFGDSISWWVKYCPKDENPCTHAFSSIVYSFTISEVNTPVPDTDVVLPAISLPKRTSNTQTKQTIVTVAKQDLIIETMEWNVTPSKSSKPFSFPFKEYIGVNQWHGNTAFQKPHTGIDFGAVKKEVLAIGDGEIVGKGWDSYNGKCMSGGNYLLVKQANGMYASYFHLQTTYVDVGKKVKSGDILGISGNTGSWNCQPLGYHLHFEVRSGRSQSTHVNPVDYIATDWSKVLTLNVKANPDRLSGDNPHPKF